MTEQTLSNQHCASSAWRNFRYTANSVHLMWLLRHIRVRAKRAGSRTHNRCAMKMKKYGAVNTRCPDARPWKIQRYIFTRLYTQSLYEQGDQGKYKKYTPPFPLLVKTRAIRFCKWPAQMSDTGNNMYYIPHLSNPAIWLVEIAFINFNCSRKFPVTMVKIVLKSQ